MKRVWKDILASAFMGVILPGMVFHFLTQDTYSAGSQETEPQQTAAAAGAQALRMTLLLPDGTVTDMDMDAYLTGVVLAEMPAAFEMEALKAQSVVARTYTLKAAQTRIKHDGAVCTDHTCCQAYTDPAEYTGSAENVDKIRTAVAATSGQVLTYEGELIEATYFSCSGGSTEDAVAVWGTDYPYLRATDSPGEESAAYYTDTVSFSAAEFAQLLGISPSGDPADWLGYTTYTAGGGVNTMRIGGQDFGGTELRALLGLRSTAFSIEVKDAALTVTTRGYGHRVGMSQYGADAMAVSGSGYREILAHYYQGTAITNFSD